MVFASTEFLGSFGTPLTIFHCVTTLRIVPMTQIHVMCKVQLLIYMCNQPFSFMKRNRDLKTASVNRHTFVTNGRIQAQELNHITCTLNASKNIKSKGKKIFLTDKNEAIKNVRFYFLQSQLDVTKIMSCFLPFYLFLLYLMMLSMYQIIKYSIKWQGDQSTTNWKRFGSDGCGQI